MRVNTVKSARKEVVCGNCRQKVEKGQGYRWAKSRYGPKMIRCMAPACDFRPTDLSSAKTARIEEAINDAHEAISSAETHEDIQAALQEVADVAQEVADEYQEANDQWAGGAGRDDLQEKVDACSSFADECSGWSGERLEDFEKRQEEAGDEAWDQTLQEMRDEAESVLDSFSI